MKHYMVDITVGKYSIRGMVIAANANHAVMQLAKESSFVKGKVKIVSYKTGSFAVVEQVKLIGFKQYSKPVKTHMLWFEIE